MIDLTSEWLETDGLGGFASGTVGGFRTRRYHALLLTARRPPTDRVVLVNGFEAAIEVSQRRYALSTQFYEPGVYYPDGQQRLESFSIDPWPTWRWQLDSEMSVELELFIPHERAMTVLAWRIVGGQGPFRLSVVPLISGRDYHALHNENPAFEFAASIKLWFRNFLYATERERGLDFVEDLASPGGFSWDLHADERAIWMLAADGQTTQTASDSAAVEASYHELRHRELERRQQFPTHLHRAADAYLVRRGTGKSIIAGYPWFTDWGRDTFISLRGICLATGRLVEAGDLLDAWASTISQGMMPNRFPDHGDQAEYNSVDASLWYVIAVHEYLRTARTAGHSIPTSQRSNLQQAVISILEGYSAGTRYGIRCDSDGLLAAGVPGVQLTWMDAKAGDWVVTPRIGKPVEIQALWLNALALTGVSDHRWRATFELGRRSFRERFWNAPQGCLFDVIDVDHQAGQVDPAIRPNQIFAVGGLPISLLEPPQAAQVVDCVASHLLTPLGLRSLSPDGAGYRGYYLGDVLQRDGAYHQGTVWPWLMGAFVEAWVRVRNGTPSVMAQARQQFLPAFEQQLQSAGLGHISEITDAEPPFTPRGCPFQAWSLGELLRLKELLVSSHEG